MRGRNITNNIIIIQEVIHSMYNKKEKKIYESMMKFLKNTLKDIGLPKSISNVIMNYMTTSSMHIIRNENVIDSFLSLEA